MISLKRNTKKELVEATGIRTRQSSIYAPNQNTDFKISRGNFNDFLTCPRCFYLDRVKGIVSPDMPGWTLNETTDLLLKREFDVCRKEQKPHRIFLENNLDHLVPFNHPDIDKWRDSLHHGLKARFKESNIILSGGIDDVWQDTKTKELIIADYKSQATNNPVDLETYFSSPYHEGYKTQLDFYIYLLKEMEFEVSQTAYLIICNADRSADGFNGTMKFSETLIPYESNINWIPQKIEEMLETINSENIPDSNTSCMNCAYARQRSSFD